MPSAWRFRPAHRPLRTRTATAWPWAFGAWQLWPTQPPAARSPSGWPDSPSGSGSRGTFLRRSGRRRVVSPKERALARPAQCRTNVGALVAPGDRPLTHHPVRWPSAFLATGAIGFIWLIFWFALYEVPERNVICEPRSSPHPERSRGAGPASSPGDGSSASVQTWAIVHRHHPDGPHLVVLSVTGFAQFLNSRFG